MGKLKHILRAGVSRGTLLLEQLDQLNEQEQQREADKVQQDDPPTTSSRRSKKRHKR